MPPLNGFSNNPFIERSDLVTAAKALVLPLDRYRSHLGARVKILPGSIAAFDDVAAQLEGFSRPLLAIEAFREEEEDVLERWMKGLCAGVDPQSPEYWGDIGDSDQRMVETESICLALLGSFDRLAPFLGSHDMNNIKKWFRQMNGKQMPVNNWLWFRILVNLTLIKIFNVPQDEVRPAMDADFAVLDSFYFGDGWSSDGKWGDERKQMDYYSGSFALQFAQLMYVRFAVDDKVRVNKYKKQAKQFSADYWRYFDINGAAIPFGRSLTYRFAIVAFWSAAAAANVELAEPVSDLGCVKGIIMRHLRWWAKQTDIFNSDGVLNIGFAYPNMYMSEAYNSSQSVYWCLKSFCILSLSQDHPFWISKEKPHPLALLPKSGLETTKLFSAPQQIVESSSGHHYLLSSAQTTSKTHKAKHWKYSKFAYSSAFGFNVPTGTTLVESSPDSTLCTSIDGGDTWVVRGNPYNARVGRAIVAGHTVPCLTSTWKPRKTLGFEIETTLVPLGEYFPGWHARIHRASWTAEADAILTMEDFVIWEGGFAIPQSTLYGSQASSTGVTDNPVGQVDSKHTPSCIVESELGVSGLVVLSLEESVDSLVLNAEPNTNLIHPRTSIPGLMRNFNKRKGSRQPQREWLLVSGVFAVPLQERSLNWVPLWNRRPRISVKHDIFAGTTRIAVE